VRVAVVNQHLRDVVGGSELQCDLVARGLRARGHDVHYVAPVPAAAPHGSAPVVMSADTDLPYALHRVTPAPEDIVAACTASRPDVVYWRFNRRGLTAVTRGLRAHGVPLVFATAHIDDVSRWPRRDWPSASTLRAFVAEARDRGLERYEWRAFRDVAAVALQREDFAGRVPVRDQRLVRNAFDASAHREVVEFSWPRPYVLWVGRVQARKRPEELRPLAVALAGVGADLLVAGATSEAALRRADLAEVPSNLHVLGLRPATEVVAMLRGAQSLAVTAREEGFSNALVQAWSVGTRTVSLSYDPDGLIRAHHLGAVCGGSREDFHAAVVGTITSPPSEDERRRIAAFAASTFDADRNLDILERLLLDVAEGR
jgi:glycosyltransferase involved in cell wall biosynthesis